MKVTCKTIAQEVFYIEAAEHETVLELKRKIETAKQFPVDVQRLVCSGRILRDEEVLSSLRLTERNFIVVTVSAQKRTPLPQTTAAKAVPPAQGKTTPTARPSTAAPESSSNKSAAQKTTAAIQPGKRTPSAKSPASPSAAEAGQQTVGVDSLMTMGFDRGQATTALAVSNNNAALAVELLLSGALPSGVVPEAVPVPQGNQQTAPIHQRQALQAALNHPQIKPLHSAIRENAEVLDDALIQLRDSNPEVAQTIEANKVVFLQMIGQLTEDDDEDHDEVDDEDASKQAKKSSRPKVGVTTVGQQMSAEFTEQDRQALELLKAMGFTEATARQAYVMCNKNEQLAANFLLDNDN